MKISEVLNEGIEDYYSDNSEGWDGRPGWHLCNADGDGVKKVPNQKVFDKYKNDVIVWYYLGYLDEFGQCLKHWDKGVLKPGKPHLT